MDTINEKINMLKNFIKELFNIIKYSRNNNDLHLLKLTYGAIYIKCKELDVFIN